jgi:serine/threonine-protein kinase RsbW
MERFLKGLSELDRGAMAELSEAPPALALAITAEPGSVIVARRALDEALEGVGITGDDLEAVRIAVGEACANVVKHAAPDGGQSRMWLALYYGLDAVTVVVRDEGDGFDPSSIPEPDVDSLPEGGMGIYLMRRVMNKVGFISSPEGTWVILTKYLSARLGES